MHLDKGQRILTSPGRALHSAALEISLNSTNPFLSLPALFSFFSHLKKKISLEVSQAFTKYPLKHTHIYNTKYIKS